ncbi:MAG: hypothetical protein EPO40_25885 [Myxococcaceae bacterium]|nr:MAG: hypothetical protein EPO40_25885 [Myxococcaceae bacterium]
MHPEKKRPRAALLGAALCLASAPAEAQDMLSRSQEVPYRAHRVLSVGLATSAILHADAVCPNDQTLCPLGGGGGIAVAIGRRTSASQEWLIGYDVSVRNARNLFASATLQQIRFEHRWVAASPASNAEAFVGVGGGVVAYGERFGVTTLGPAVSVSVGGSYYLSPFVSLGFVGRLEALRFLVPFDTGDGVRRSDGGIATVLLGGYFTGTFRGP